MSGKDETDLVRNKELSMENTMAQSTTKNNNHDLSNGDTAPMNGDSSTNPVETNKQTTVESTTPKPITPSNWVQFENEDENSDKVTQTRKKKKKTHYY